MSTSEISITMTPVESSQIAAIGHDANNSVLAIQFKRGEGLGSTYHYQNFGADHFKQLQEAPSVGSHFYKNIKPFANKFPYQKIG